MSEAVNVTGAPRIVLDVGGATRYATYAAGTGTASLTFTYAATAGDVDLDGIGIASTTLDLNGGAVTDLNGNPETNLTFTAPANMSSVFINYPSLYMDFTADSDGRYSLSGTVYNDLTSFLAASGGTFSRASVGTYFDSAGTLQTAASGAPRFDYDPVTHTAKGVLIEENRTNTIPNSSMSGASIGTLPTTWSFQNVAGVTASVVATGTESGIPYIDVRFSGTPSATGTLAIFFSTASSISASNGQTWALSIYKKLVAGSTANLLNTLISNQIYSSSPTYLGGVGNLLITPTSSSLSGQRVSYSGTISNASTAYIRPFFATSVTNGQAIDITIRLGAPQLELASFPTSFIATTNAAVTRLADTLTIPTGGWFNNSEGTMTTTSSLPYLGGAKYPGTMSFDNGTQANSIHMFISDASGDEKASEVFLGGVPQFSSFGTAYSAGSLLRQGLSYKTNDTIMSMDGVLGTLDTSVSLPTVTILRIGLRRGGSDPLNGNIQKAKYYPLRVNSTQLQLLTQ
ncbi:MAG: hypothetical protein WC043_02485 [Pseudobdellovibrionaceae bacterium]